MMTTPLTLHGFRLFEGLPPEVVERFTEAAAFKRYAEGEMIFDQETDGRDVHFIVQGKVRLLTAVEAGEPMTLAEVPSGEIFGELAAIDQRPRSARAVAACESVLGSIDGPVLISLLEYCPVVAIRMLKRLATIIRSMDVRLASIAVMTPTQRVIAELMRRAEPDARVPGQWLIAYSPTHAEIASWVGIDREDVAQTIGALARDALVRRRGGSLVLLDWAALQGLARPENARVAALKEQAQRPQVSATRH